MKNIVFLFCICFSLNLSAQEIRGKVFDKETKENLIGADILWISGIDTFYTTSALDGSFQIQVQSNTGRIQFSYLGYSDVTLNISEIPQQILSIGLEIRESDISIFPVIIAYPSESTDIRFSRKEFQLLPGAYEDPSRLLLKAPGFTTFNDQANYILYKGMPPQFVNWSVNGAKVINPNHLSNAGSLSDISSINAGGVNMISGQVIGQYRFSGSPFNLHVPNAIGGNSDILFTEYKKKYLNLSLIGIEAGFGMEETKLPFQLNYRNSTVGLLSNLGVNFGGENIRYQDFFSSIDLLKSENSKINAFFSIGNSSNYKAPIENRQDAQTSKDLQLIEFDSRIILSGGHFEHKKENSNTKISINYSNKSDSRYALDESSAFENIDQLEQSLFSSLILHQFQMKRSSLKSGLSINQSLDNRSRLSSVTTNIENQFSNFNAFLFSSANFSLGKFLTELGMGINYNSNTQNILIEPQFSITGPFTSGFRIDFNYRRNNQLLSPINFSYQYTPKEIQGDHFELKLDFKSNQYEAFFSLFAHALSDVLFEQGSNYSQFTGLDHPLIRNISYDGRARSRGAALGIQWKNALLEGLNLSGNISAFVAEYANENGVWLNNTFDFSDSYNLMANYKINLANKKELYLSVSWHQRNGLNEFAIDPVASVFYQQTQFDFTTEPFWNSLGNYQRIDFRVVYSIRKANDRKFAQYLSLDIQNVSNRENDAFSFYDAFLDEVQVQNQLGLLPILAYRIEF